MKDETNNTVIDNMKCCANCEFYGNRKCKKYDIYRETGEWPEGWRYYDCWQSDGLTRAEREGK